MLYLISLNWLFTASGWFNRTAVPILVYKQSGSATQTAITFAVAHIPVLIAGVIGSPIPKGMGPIGFLKATTAASLIALITCSVGYAYHNMPVIVLALFLNSMASALQYSVYHALIASASSPNNFPQNNAKVLAGDTLASLFVPLISSSVSFFIPGAVVFIISSLPYVVAFYILRWKISAKFHVLPDAKPEKHPLHKQHRKHEYYNDYTVRVVALSFMFANASSGLLQAILVPSLISVAEASGQTIGLVISAGAVGSLAGLYLSRNSVKLRNMSVAKSVVVLNALNGLGLSVLCFWHSALSFAGALFVSSLLGAVSVTTFSTYRAQKYNGDELRLLISRMRGFTYLPIPIAAAASGFIFDTYGLIGVVITAVTIRIVPAAILVFTKDEN